MHNPDQKKKKLSKCQINNPRPPISQQKKIALDKKKSKSEDQNRKKRGDP